MSQKDYTSKSDIRINQPRIRHVFYINVRWAQQYDMTLTFQTIICFVYIWKNSQVSSGSNEKVRPSSALVSVRNGIEKIHLTATKMF